MGKGKGKNKVIASRRGVIHNFLKSNTSTSRNPDEKILGTTYIVLFNMNIATSYT
jgi:hypothetical protein